MVNSRMYTDTREQMHKLNQLRYPYSAIPADAANQQLHHAYDPNNSMLPVVRENMLAFINASDFTDEFTNVYIESDINDNRKPEEIMADIRPKFKIRIKIPKDLVDVNDVIKAIFDKNTKLLISNYGAQDEFKPALKRAYLVSLN